MGTNNLKHNSLPLLLQRPYLRLNDAKMLDNRRRRSRPVTPHYSPGEAKRKLTERFENTKALTEDGK